MTTVGLKSFMAPSTIMNSAGRPPIIRLAHSRLVEVAVSREYTGTSFAERVVAVIWLSPLLGKWADAGRPAWLVGEFPQRTRPPVWRFVPGTTRWCLARWP